MIISNEVMAFWRSFREKPGSDHMATPVSLQFLKEYCAATKPASILELGAGIGTMTTFLEEYGVDAYEDIPFCLGELAKNAPRANVIKSYETLPPKRDYDLVIIDGGDGGKNGGYKQATSVLLSYVSPRAVYVEGVRTPQRIEVLWSLCGRRAIKMRRVKGQAIDGTYYKGGTIFFTPPSQPNGLAQIRGAASLIYNLSRLRFELLLRAVR
ncbi:MAG TPA: hypothetical protein VJK73_02310 [Candidatus Paceibacterota bacterium]